MYWALFFGFLTDRLGRKKLFSLTLLVYLIGTALSACSWNFATYALFRFLTGSGIGGEYAAINSAIDELIPARIRGRIDITINATYCWNLLRRDGRTDCLWLSNPNGLAWCVVHWLPGGCSIDDRSRHCGVNIGSQSRASQLGRGRVSAVSQ
jgi:hypothetical protein